MRILDYFIYYLPNVLSSITIDDYIIFDKWSLAFECMNGNLNSCWRVFGL